jgi:cytochrome P450
MYSFIRKEVDKRFEELKNSQSPTETTRNPSKRARSVMALALEGYITQQHQKAKTPEDTTKTLHLDESFAQLAVSQIRLFILAGNDATSSTIVYCYHLLYKNPDTLSKLREEHNIVFGPDPNATASLLRANPALQTNANTPSPLSKKSCAFIPPHHPSDKVVPAYP